ncbi:MAG TPA: MerR family transcriptional regulator [Longimicrobium sp.]|nr:MerR family transcriptional regulator [Longimicrobium sp.]
MTYRIKRVASLTGINPATLRAWERRYQLLTPLRSPAGYRLYSDADVATLARIKRLIDEGWAIGEAITRVRESTESRAAFPEGGALEEVRADLTQGLLAMDRVRAQTAWERLDSAAPLRRVDEVLMPVMREVGERWARGEIGIADEHYASAFAREKLATLFEAMDGRVASGPLSLCAGLPGEHHELGLLGAAVHLQEAGWRVIYLGVEVPLEEMGRVADEHHPVLLCTSVMRPTRRDEFRRVADGLSRIAPQGTEVVIGGGGIPRGIDPLPLNVRVATSFQDLLAAG